MAAGGLSSVELTEAYLAPDRAARPAPPRRHRDEPRRARDRRPARRRTAGRPGPRSAPRHPRPGQGQHRDQRRDGDDGRLAGAGRQPGPARRADRRPAAGGRARSSSARRTCRNGRTSAASSRRPSATLASISTAGARAGASPATRTASAWDPCGSSSGSAVAPAANLCAIAIGTETDGSIVCPSGSNAVVGLKPTVGLVAQAGIIPIAHSQDTAGPMARTVTDAAIALNVLRSPFGAVRGRRLPRDYRAFLRRGALRGARIGVDRRLFSGDSSADAGLNARHGAGLRGDAIARRDARRSDRAARHQVDPRRRADRPVHRVQGRHRGLPGRPSADDDADPGRPDRLQRRALRRRAALLRAGAVRRRRRDARPRRPGLPRGTGALPGRDGDQRHRPHPGRRPARRDRRAGLRRFDGARRSRAIRPSPSRPARPTTAGPAACGCRPASSPSRPCSASRSTSRARSAAGPVPTFAGTLPDLPPDAGICAIPIESRVRTRRSDLPADV